MENFYFKHRTKYLNGTEAKGDLFYRINQFGVIESVSLASMKIKKPRMISFYSDFEWVTKEEFEAAKNKVLVYRK